MSHGLRVSRIILANVAIIFTFQGASAFAADCTTVLTAIPGGVQFTAATPTSIYEGSIATLKLQGQGLRNWTVLLCPVSGSATPPVVSAAPNFQSSATVLNQTISAPVGTAGQYDVRVVNAAQVYDTKLGLIVNSSSDVQYQPCSAPGGLAVPNANLQCSFNPLPYRIALDAFGTGVADRFVAIYVTVQNKNDDFEYILQDIRGGLPSYVVSSYDKTLPQQIATKTEQLSARAISIRLTSAVAGVVSGISGFYGSVAFQEAANIFSGPAQAGLNSVIPDFSASELNFINNHAFSSASAVISKGGTIALFAFFDEATLPPSTTWTNKHPEKTWRRLGALSTYSGTELRTLFQGMTISVSGNHVAQVTPPTTPAAPPPAATTINIGAKPPGAAVGSPVAIPVTVSGAGAGTCTGGITSSVTLVSTGAVVGSTPPTLTSGAGNVTFTPSAAGSYAIAVTYTPDATSPCGPGSQTTPVTLP